jgi:hypothetical protein
MRRLVGAVSLLAVYDVRYGSKTDINRFDFYVLCGWLPRCKDFIGVAFWSGAVLCPAC